MPETQRIDAQRRAAIAGALGVTALRSVAAAPAEGLALPGPDRNGGMALTQALLRRRSVRHYGPQPLALRDLAQLLWAAQGNTASGGRRTAPSAGALYPLELHLVAARVQGLAAGVHRYLPAAHALQGPDAVETAAALARAAAGQPAVASAAAVLVVAAVDERSTHKYGSRAARYVAFEAGAAAQNLALQAAALGLGVVVIGGFDDVVVARALRLPAGERPVVMLPIGVPA